MRSARVARRRRYSRYWQRHTHRTSWGEAHGHPPGSQPTHHAPTPPTWPPHTSTARTKKWLREAGSVSRACAPRRSARIGADRRGGELDGCRTARGTLCAGRPTAIQFLLPAQRETSAVSEIHQTHRFGGHARVPRAALTLPVKENPVCFRGLGLCDSSCGTSQRPATSTPAWHR